MCTAYSYSLLLELYDHISLRKIVIASARSVSYWKLWTQTRNTQKQKLTLAVRQPSYENVDVKTYKSHGPMIRS